jgi:hypothetical protein
MIDITKPVRTRDGTPVEIISNKGREPYTLVGYIGNGRELDEWAADGAYLTGTKSNNDLENYEPEPWKLSDPPEGQKWHRDDWTEDMLPEGYRPLLLGETRESEDEFLFEPYGCASKWRISGGVPSCVNEADPAWCHHRTKRPLPEPKPEEWAAEKAAFVEGRAIQFQPKGFNKWFDCPEPTWSSDFKYRIKPEPQWVPMEPDDIVVGMEFTNDTGTRYQWAEVDTYGVTLLDSPISFERLLQLGYEYRINGGEWKPCKKEVRV